jgi:tRNA(Ile)-lysidine synthase
MAKVSMVGLDRSLVGAGERVCVAVSGGADSVALLLALHEANAAKEPLGVVLSAVHVNHGLRAEADADETFVRGLCERLGVPLLVERVDVAARRSAEREGLEEAARELRYGVFRGLMASGKAEVVATAHTLDDQAETVVMKLLRGAWTEGIGGIAPELQGSGIREQGTGNRDQGSGNRDQGLGNRDQGTGNREQGTGIREQGLGMKGHGPGGQRVGASGRIVRPMLGVRRAEVEAYLRERGQAWCEDATNRDVSLRRNRVRHELMPVLREFNPGVDAALARLAEIARDEEAYWRAEVERVLPQAVLPGKPVRGGGRAVSTEPGNSSCAVEVERLRGMAPALRRRVLRAAARGLGCRISAEETAKLLALGGFGDVTPPLRARPGTRLELAGGLKAERTAREIQLRVENASFVARTGGR